MRRNLTLIATAVIGVSAAPAAADVTVGSSGASINVADGGGSGISYGVADGEFLLHASPAPRPVAPCTTTADPSLVSCPMSGIGTLNVALGAGSALDRAVGAGGPDVAVNVSGAGANRINLEGGRNVINVRNGQPDTVNCRSGGPNLTTFDAGLDVVSPNCNATAPPVPTPVPIPTPTPTPAVGHVRVVGAPRLSGRRLAIRLSCAGINVCAGTLRAYVSGRRIGSRAVSVGSFSAQTVSLAVGGRNRTRLRRGATVRVTYAGRRVFSGRVRA